MTTELIVPKMVEGELRIYDIELAERLGFARPRTIRELIERHVEALSALGAVCRMVRQTSGKGGRPATEYYLNRRQAIFITAKSETAEATDITIEIIERFDAYERGEAPLALAGQVVQKLSEQNALLAQLAERVAALEGGHDPKRKAVKDWFTMADILTDQRTLKPWKSIGRRCWSSLHHYAYDKEMHALMRPGLAPDERWLFNYDLV
jgi:hypothetical protein